VKIYIRAYWFDDDNESIDDFIYERNPKSDPAYKDSDDELFEVLPDDPYEDSTGYSDFDEYDLYDYSEYEDFYRQILRRKIYVPLKVANDIPDYNAYRKALFNTLYLSMKSGESIEDLYYELSQDFPGIIKDDYINASDMLLEIVDATLYAQSILNQSNIRR
jgi:hypothetical protein